MPAISIEEPSTVASLPKAFDRANGRIYASSVCGIDGSRKRKRHEVAVSIDGEALNIYNIRSQSLTTSYALPPQTLLCCPPCSIYRKATSPQSAQRRTYLIVKENVNSLKRRLVCFTEEVRSKRRETEFPAPAKSQHDLHEGRVIGLDIVPGTSSNQYSLIVSYDNGDVQMVADDLSKSYHEASSNGTDASDYRVEHASVLDFTSARKGMLKGREDVVALLDSNTSAPTGNHLLCRIVRTPQQRRLELYTHRDPLQTELRTIQGALQLIMEYDLTFSSKLSASPTRYELHAGSGTLYQLRKGKLAIIDLSGTTPKLVTKIGAGSERSSSFCRVSTGSILTFNEENATLLETSFGSIQATVSVFPGPSAGSISKKRKRNDHDGESPPFHAICAYADIGCVVAIAGQELVVLQLNFPLQRSRSALAAGALLRDAKPNGVMSATSSQKKNEKKMQNWEKWAAEVDRLVDADDMEGLENLVSNDREFGRQRKVDRNADADDVDAISYADLWPLPEAFDPQDVEKRKALYLLAKVFASGEEYGESIHIRVPSFKLLELFALSGLLSTSYLKFVLSQYSGRSLESIRPGDVMKAINVIDDDFQFMHDLLSLPVALEPADVMQALRIVADSFNTPAEQEAHLALPAPPQRNGVLTNGDAELEDAIEEADIELESKALEMELDYVVNALHSGLETRSETIWQITRRLSLLPRKTVTTLMRSMLPPHEIIFFIHILRIELADGGWTSTYIGDGEYEGQERLTNLHGEIEQSSPNNKAIQIIAHLLGCAIDAIGTTGWLVGQSSSAQGTDGIIANLKAEVGAGLEGCYEAHTLKTLLAELEGHAAVLDKKEHLRVVDDAMEVDEMDAGPPLLPLGSAAERMMLGNGKGAKKTKKAARMEASRKVGDYAFERIRI